MDRKFFGWAIIIALAFGLIGYASAEYSESDKEGSKCISCHDDIWQDAIGKRFIHLPFSEKQCEKCHAADARLDNNIDRKIESPDIKWLSRNRTPAKTHWFDLEASTKGDLIHLEARSGQKGVVTKEVSVPSLEELDQVTSSSQNPPVITNVKVLEVSKGIFLSATVGWETDKPASSKVLYGLNDLSQQSPLDRQFARVHEVSLTGIKANRDYKFAVVSEDMSGNRSESKTFAFSTDKTFSDRDIMAESDAQSGGEMEISGELFRNGNGYSLKVTVNRAAMVAIGLKTRKYSQSAARRKEGPEVVKHVITNSEAVTTISICYSCHADYKKILSHPINVYPKRGMKIPPEYPTLSDGRITCMSCHATHASNLQFRMLKPHKKDLCLGCHADMV
ncbi:MAG: hypothetical protein KKG47_07930 [Proteobacteria bacterium]|nr:hypothetical protein [Pseudomonadota bacterium]MBU1738227.1 hypothetical protein [Pseudomonadota bacterium]